MKPTTINVQITKNPKQYEAVRLGLEASLDPNESVQDAITAATNELNRIYAEMYPPKQAEQSKAPAEAAAAPAKKEILTFEDKRVQQIVNRIEKAGGDKAKIDNILKQVDIYYTYDDNVKNVFAAAVKLNQIN